MSWPRIVDTDLPLTEGDLQAFESRVGEGVPEPYRTFLLEHNAAEPSRSLFHFTGESGERKSSKVRRFLGLGSGDNPGELWHTLLRGRKRIPPDLFPIATDSVGKLIILGSRGPRAGKVYLWDHDRGAMPLVPMTYDTLFLIAKSFDAFLENLEAEPERPFPPPVIHGGSKLSEDKLRSFEQRIGQAVPEPYRAFLLEHNGGVPERNIVYYQAWSGMRRAAIVTGFLGVGIGPPHDLGRVLEIRRKRILADLFPIARDGTGSLIVIGSQGPRAGKLYFWDASGTHPDQPPEKAVLFFICGSLEEFLGARSSAPKDD